MNTKTFWGPEILWKWDSSCRQSWIFKVDLIGSFRGFVATTSDPDLSKVSLLRACVHVKFSTRYGCTA